MDVLTTGYQEDHLEPQIARHRAGAVLVSMLCYGFMLLALLAGSLLLG